MNPVLVIIRGNSGSGKTVLANKVQEHFGCEQCLLLHQDEIRRDILHANDHQGTPAVGMIETMITYGLEHYPITMIEGILRKDVYGDMLKNVAKPLGKQALIYYLEIPFETTVAHDKTKREPFGAEKLRSWWQEEDYLDEEDRIFHDGKTLNLAQHIITDILKASSVMRH